MTLPVITADEAKAISAYRDAYKALNGNSAPYVTKRDGGWFAIDYGGFVPVFKVRMKEIKRFTAELERRTVEQKGEAA